MKKSCIFLFVMSIISILIAAFGAIGLYQVWDTYSVRKELNSLYGNDVDKAFTEMPLYTMFLIFAILLAA